MSFPDVETIAQALIAPYADAYKWLPDDLDKVLEAGPVAIVERVGGSMDGVTDRAEVQVSVWAATRNAAWEAIRNIAEEFNRLRFGGRVAGVFVDTTEQISGGIQIASNDPDERRVNAIFRLDVRAQHAAARIE